MIEDVTDWQKIRDLGSIKLSKEKIRFVSLAKESLQSNGSLAPDTRKKLNKIYRDHARSLKSLHESRERARISMARQKMGLSESDVHALQKARVRTLKAQINDFGF